jgi:uncharacterized membrane protein YkvA (DUF1232 family)
VKDFYQGLREDIAEYEGKHDDWIYLAPEWYRLLTNLLDNPRLPVRLKPLVCCGIAYFILPADVIPEEVYGPYGYVDDIFFSAYVADQVARLSGDPELLRDAWEGEGEVLELVRDVLTKEKQLVEDKAELILQYTGCSNLLALLQS